MKFSYQLISASGNPTAIVYGQFLPSQKNKITSAIFARNKLVEQVGFIYQKSGQVYFDMMGGEFCVNGCRSAAFSLLKFKPGITSFKASGTAKTITAQISTDFQSSIKLPCSPVPKNFSYQPFFSITLFGSKIFVIPKLGNQILATRILNSLSCEKYPGIGIMFFRACQSEILLNPYFYVPQTKTFINETACGSGSLAVALYLKYFKNISQSIYSIRQPSGLLINIKFGPTTIEGPTRFLGNYNVTINL
ncbi:MAG: hypothetical protein WC686_05655 [Candidatus Shapirobacteria bacterium]|jgi:diaminopimelate epimerase